MKEAYLDEIEAGEYFIDPYDLEGHYSVEQFGGMPDWEKLYKEGWVAWYPEDQDSDFVLYLSTSFYTGETVTLCDNSRDELNDEIDHKNVMVLCTDCFGEICDYILKMADELLQDNDINLND